MAEQLMVFDAFNNCHSERSEVLRAIARCLRDESDFVAQPTIAPEKASIERCHPEATEGSQRSTFATN